MGKTYQEFLLRRFHSLTGMAPMGVFLFEHFFTNSFSHQGAAEFNAKADFLRHLPYILVIEIVFLLLPFAFHIIYGLYIIYTGEVNVHQHGHGRNWMYFIQRLTAFPSLAFILFHVISVRVVHGHEPDLYAVMADWFSNKMILAFYVVGTLATAIHFGNGMATFCMTWGITIGPTSQRMAGYAGAAVALVLSAMAIYSIFGFTPEGAAAAAEKLKETPEAVGLVVQCMRPLVT